MIWYSGGHDTIDVHYQLATNHHVGTLRTYCTTHNAAPMQPRRAYRVFFSLDTATAQHYAATAYFLIGVGSLVPTNRLTNKASKIR